MTVNDPKKNHPYVQMNFDMIKGFKFQPHPDVNKQSWNKNKLICAADEENGLPAHTKLDAIRYRYASKDEGDIPFSINVFNAKKAGKNLITLEIEMN